MSTHSNGSSGRHYHQLPASKILSSHHSGGNFCGSIRSSYSGKSDMITCNSLRSHTTLPHYTKYLESKISSIQEQSHLVLTENMNLNNQLSRATMRVQDLEEALLRDKGQLRREPPRHKTFQTDNQPTTHRGVNTQSTVEKLDVSTVTDNRGTLDCAAQTATPDKAPHEPQPILVEASSDPSPYYVTISKLELENLERDMKVLRDAVKAKEDQWDQALEREASFRKHLARLSVELMNARQLSDSRYNEIQILVQKLTEKKQELRDAQKELSAAKKVLMKYQKRRARDGSPGEISADESIPEMQPHDTQDQKQLRPKTTTRLAGKIREPQQRFPNTRVRDHPGLSAL